MRPSSLHIVTPEEAAALTAPQEPVAAKVRRLQAEAKELAREHVHSLSAAILTAGAIAHEIAQGGDVYNPGIRDLARRFVEDADARVATIEAIIGRQP